MKERLEAEEEAKKVSVEANLVEANGPEGQPQLQKQETLSKAQKKKLAKKKKAALAQ